MHECSGCALVLHGCCVQMVIPEALKALPQQNAIVPECLVIAALLKNRVSKLAPCDGGRWALPMLSAAPARLRFSHSCLRQSHAELAHKSLFARRTFIMGVSAVLIRLHHACHMDVSCRTPARAPSQQFAAGLQTYPAGRGVCAHAVSPRLRAFWARKLAHAGRSAAPRSGITRRLAYSESALTPVLLPMPRLARPRAVARSTASTTQMWRGLAPAARAGRHC